MHLTLKFGNAWVTIRQRLDGLSLIRTLPSKRSNGVPLFSSDNGDRQSAFDDEGEASSADEIPFRKNTTPTPSDVIPDNGKQQRQLQKQPQQGGMMSSRDIMNALGTSPRRIVLSLVSSSAIALGGNLFGVTSWVETLFPEEAVEATGLDTYFPRGMSNVSFRVFGETIAANLFPRSSKSPFTHPYNLKETTKGAKDMGTPLSFPKIGLLTHS